MDESVQKHIEAALPPSEEQWALWGPEPSWCPYCLQQKHRSYDAVAKIHDPAHWMSKGAVIRRVFG